MNNAYVNEERSSAIRNGGRRVNRLCESDSKHSTFELVRTLCHLTRTHKHMTFYVRHFNSDAVNLSQVHVVGSVQDQWVGVGLK